jgi:UDPglucose 6-dehydrogenase/GDP-mannose 6-dehydrogenase
MKIGIIGCGYVGLVTGTGMAEIGHTVYCYDQNPEIVQRINRGECHFYEPGLEEMLEKNTRANRVIGCDNLDDLFKTVEVVFICVGTPSNDEGIDLSYISDVCVNIGLFQSRAPDSFLHIVIKSTVIPGTTDTHVRNELRKCGARDNQYALAMIPEFLREGNALSDFFNADRIVIGCQDEHIDFYFSLFKALGDRDVIFTNTRTAEMIKYANNAILATQISIINELSNYSEIVGLIDFDKVVQGVIFDHRWSPKLNSKRYHPGITNYLKPGPGYGGSCFPKDVKAIVKSGLLKNIPMTLLHEVENVNDRQSEMLVNRVVKLVDYLGICDLRVLILGVSFKPDTDDIRESPSIKVINELIKIDCDISVHDPMSRENFLKLNYQDICFVDDIHLGLEKNNVIILMTPWSQFLEIDYSLSLRRLEKIIFYDTRNAVSNLMDFPENVTLLKPGTNHINFS